MGSVERLVVCFDGTWNTDRSNTNVSRLFRKIADQANGCLDQRRFYDEGVGTRMWERIRGGVLGAGLDENIRQGYGWLAAQFAAALEPGTAPDDAGFVVGPKLYLFGFSRGAFTARSLAGLINYLGIPQPTRPDGPAAASVLGEDPAVKDAWTLYAARPRPEIREAVKVGTASADVAREVEAHDAAVSDYRRTHAHYPVRIHFLGVWDTVGALGIPRVLDYPWVPRFSTKYQFHDTQLGRSVRFAYHAVAIDENREPYCVALWTGRPETTEAVEQRWFPGAHADVGGGYEDDLLPDPPLAWIAQKAAACGLHFVNDRGLTDAGGAPLASVDRAPAAFDLDGREYLSPVHDSYAEFLAGTYRVVRSIPGAGGRVYRRMLVPEDGIGQAVDETAFKKMDADVEYRPPNLAQAGRAQVSFNVARLDQGDLEPDVASAPLRTDV